RAHGREFDARLRCARPLQVPPLSLRAASRSGEEGRPDPRDRRQHPSGCRRGPRGRMGGGGRAPPAATPLLSGPPGLPRSGLRVRPVVSGSSSSAPGPAPSVAPAGFSVHRRIAALGALLVAEGAIVAAGFDAMPIIAPLNSWWAPVLGRLGFVVPL